LATATRRASELQRYGKPGTTRSATHCPPPLEKTESTFPEQKNDWFREEVKVACRKKGKRRQTARKGKINERLLLAKGVDVAGCLDGNRNHPDEILPGTAAIQPEKERKSLPVGM
jgi:hypothetical protein